MALAGTPAVPGGLLGGKVAGLWKTGDWSCPLCQHHNYRDKVQCNRCAQPKPQGAGAPAGGVAPGRPLGTGPVAPEGDWTCEPCSFVNLAKYKNARCFRCGADAPDTTKPVKKGPYQGPVAPDDDWVCDCGFVNQHHYKNLKCFRCGGDCPKEAPLTKMKRMARERKEIRREEAEERQERRRRAKLQAKRDALRKQREGGGAGGLDGSDDEVDTRPRRPLDMFGDVVPLTVPEQLPTADADTAEAVPARIRRTPIGKLPPWEVQRRVREMAEQMLLKEAAEATQQPTPEQQARKREREEADRVLDELSRQAKQRRKADRAVAGAARPARPAPPPPPPPSTTAGGEGGMSDDDAEA